jgi:hypothetical protein
MKVNDIVPQQTAYLRSFHIHFLNLKIICFTLKISTIIVQKPHGHGEHV